MQLHVLARGFDPQIFSSPGGQGPRLTQCLIKPHKCTCHKLYLNPSNGLSKVHECDKQKDDRKMTLKRSMERKIGEMLPFDPVRLRVGGSIISPPPSGAWAEPKQKRGFVQFVCKKHVWRRKIYLLTFSYVFVIKLTVKYLKDTKILI